ncbi:glycosyltransferase family 39 protein [bacterium]|nr:glycosyltransferase family 39 protein [bacterium]
MSRHRAIIWLFIASLAVRLFLVLIHTDVKLVDEMNGYDYGARTLLQGKGLYSVEVDLQDKRYRPFRAFLPPGYSVFLAGIYGVFGHSYFASRVVQSLLGALSVILAYLVGVRMFDKKVALLGAWILAFYPQSVQFADLLQTETLFLFLFLLAMLCFMKSLYNGSWRVVVAAGVLFGATALVRSIIMFFMLLVLAYVVAFVRRRAITGRVLVVTLLMFAVISPWTIRNYLVLDAFVPINSKVGWDFFQHNHSGFSYIMHNISDAPGEDEADRLAMDSEGYIDEIRLSRVCQSLAFRWIKEHPFLFVVKGIRQQWNLFSLERTFFVNMRRGYYGDVPKWLMLIAGSYMGLPFILLLPLAIIGFVYTDRRGLAMRIVLLLFGYFMLLAFAAYILYRQRYPLLPFLCLFAAVAILRRKEVLADIKNLGDKSAKKRIVICASLITFYAIGWLIDIGLSVPALLGSV